MILMMDVKDVCIGQSMPGRNWCKSINSRMHPYLRERFVLIIWDGMCDPRFAYPKYRASFLLKHFKWLI